jgi:mRNA interferase MazF
MRSEIVLVDFALPSGKRPALVVQNDRDNQRMGNTIVAQITTNVSRAKEDTQFLIDPSHPDWLRSGLKKASAINCLNLATIQQADIRKVIGTLSPETMRNVD